MATANSIATTPATLSGAVKELFGDRPEDVISPIKSAADALGWLEEILYTIKKEALDERNGDRIQRLAEAGAYLALDMGNYAGHQHETYIDRLKAADAKRIVDGRAAQ